MSPAVKHCLGDINTWPQTLQVYHYLVPLIGPHPTRGHHTNDGSPLVSHKWIFNPIQGVPTAISVPTYLQPTYPFSGREGRTFIRWLPNSDCYTPSYSLLSYSPPHHPVSSTNHVSKPHTSPFEHVNSMLSGSSSTLSCQPYALFVPHSSGPSLTSAKYHIELPVRDSNHLSTKII